MVYWQQRSPTKPFFKVKNILSSPCLYIFISFHLFQIACPKLFVFKLFPFCDVLLPFWKTATSTWHIPSHIRSMFVISTECLTHYSLCSHLILLHPNHFTSEWPTSLPGFFKLKLQSLLQHLEKVAIIDYYTANEPKHEQMKHHAEHLWRE